MEDVEQQTAVQKNSKVMRKHITIGIKSQPQQESAAEQRFMADNVSQLSPDTQGYSTELPVPTKLPVLTKMVAQESSSAPACSQTYPSPPSSHPPPLLSANLTPPQPVVMAVKLSPLRPTAAAAHLTQWSSSTHPAGGQTVPSQPSGHPSPLLSANLTHPHP